MEAKSVSLQELSQMCRLCLSDDAALISMSSFSKDLNAPIKDVVLTCATVDLTKYSELPNYICLPCYTQLVKTRKFQIRAVQANRTLYRYLRQLQSVKQPELRISMMLSKNCNIHSDEFNALNDTLQSNIEDTIEDNSYEEINLDLTTTANSYNVDNNTITCEETDNMTIEYEDTKIGIANREVNKVDSIPQELLITDKSLNPHTEVNVKSEPKIYDSFENKIFKQQDKDFLVNMRTTNKRRNDKGESRVDKSKHKKLMQPLYQCDLCSKGFNYKSALKVHKLIHTGEKPYHCYTCNRSFRQLSNLNVHNLLHTGEKPYRCNICKKSFRQSSNLISHRQTCHL